MLRAAAQSLRHRSAALAPCQGGRPRPQAAAFASQSQDGRVALVSGASRGLGLEFVRQLLERPEQRVIAACRDPDGSEGLQQLLQTHGDRLDTVRVDVTDEDSIQKAAARVSSGHSHLNALISTTGILHSGDMMPETALARLEARNMLTNYQINAMGPVLMAKAFAPLLVNAGKVAGASDERPAVVASLSARVGSIGDNGIGGWHSYRAAKSALNQLNRCMAIEFARKKQKVACIVLHPGTVDTDLSKPFQKNVKPEKLFSRKRAVRQLLEIIDATTTADSGRFIAWDKQDIPW